MNANTNLRKRLADYHGDVPVAQALPYGIQHVLAMFVSNLAPIIIICAAAGLGTDDSAMLIQNAMIAAGIGTLIQLFGVWRVGAKMPIVMGLSFTFVTVLSGVAATYGMGAAVGAVIVGGCIEGVLGLFAKYWYKYIGNIVSAVVVVSIGFSLLSTGAETFAGGSSAVDFGSWENLFLGTISLLACLLFQRFAKGSVKQLNILFGLAFGYIVALFMGKVDFSGFQNLNIISLPHLMPFAPEFNIGAIISMTLLFLVSAAETIGDTGAIARIGFDRNPSEREISGAVAADGFTSAIAGVFGCSPLTSFAQNIGLIGMTGVVNRRAIACGAAVLIIAGFVPAVSAVFSSVPNAVLGGCTIMMFGTIVTSGFQMVASAGFTQRNITIAATSLAIGVGFSQVSVIFASFPELVQNIFVNNSIALTFLVALVMNLVMPKEAKPVVVADGDDAQQANNDTEQGKAADSNNNANDTASTTTLSEATSDESSQAAESAFSDTEDEA